MAKSGINFFSAKVVDSNITFKTIPYVPDKVNLKDLKDNLSLLSDNDTIGYMILTKESQGRISKRSIASDAPYSVIRNGDLIELIYKGKRHSLGEGNSGRVKLVFDPKTKKWGSLKIISVAINHVYEKRMPEKHNEIMQNSLNILSDVAQCEVDALSQSNQLITGPLYRISFKKDEMQANIAMTLAEGVSLEELINDDTAFFYQFPTVFWIQMGLDIIDALQEFHDKYNMLHCDLKPANIIYNFEKKKATLVDMGSAEIKDEYGEVNFNHIMGTPLYMDFELRHIWLNSVHDKIQKKQLGLKPNLFPATNTEKSDIYALLISLAELYQVFDPPDTLELFEAKKNYITKEGHEFYDNNSRITIPSILKQLVNFLDHSTCGDREERVSLAVIKAHFQILKNQARLASSKIEVGFLNVDEYLFSNKKERSLLLKKVRQLHEVRLIDITARKDIDYVKIKAELKQYVAIVGSEVAICPDLKTIEKNMQTIVDNELGYKLRGCCNTYMITNQKKKENKNIIATDSVPMDSATNGLKSLRM